MTPLPPAQSLIVHFDLDTTFRWSCRAGDFVLWFATPSMMDQRLRIADVWELCDGDYITITNRLADLPPWFQLHPLDTAGSIARRMMEMLDDRYEPPSAPISGPNIWRANVGSRIAWVGCDLPTRPSAEGLIQLLDLNCNALVFGETNQISGESILNFGALKTYRNDPTAVKRCQAAVAAVKALGIPHQFGEWKLGC